MQLIDKDNRPITDLSTLPAIEAATQMATAVDEAEAAGEDQPDPLTTTAGKNGTPELEAVLGTTSTDEVSESDDKRLCPRDQMVARLRNIRERLMSYAGQLGDRKAAVSAFVATAQSLDMAIAGAATLPPDWKPVRASATAALAEGIHVFIRSKHRALYQSDLSADDMDDMLVMRVGEKRLRCHCVISGLSIFIPAGHVEVR
jgi:hypothetical protein